MQIVGHGVDIVQCARIERVWGEHGDLFLRRVFTPAEREHCLSSRTPVVRLSGRFAAKEAALKALGTGWRGGILWTDVETLPDPLGKPVVHLHGEAARLADAQRIERVLMTISHAGDYAVASAIALSP